MLHVLQGADAAGGQGPGAWVESGTGGNANQAAIPQLIRILDDFILVGVLICRFSS